MIQYGSRQMGRRSFLRNGTLILVAGTGGWKSAQAADSSEDLRIGLITDVHYADKPPAGSRHYRESLAKLDEAAGQFERDQPALVVELGDLIDAADSVASEQIWLRTINQKFSAVCDQRHYVLGNHCVDTLTKEEFLGAVEREKSYYSFDEGGTHFIVLDACFRSDGQPYGRHNFQWTDANIPPAELEWLKADLQAGDTPVVVFAHQRLDVRNHHGVKNNADVRAVLEASGRIRAVVQGHSHQNDLKEIHGIPYVTLAAMVEGTGADNNGYSVMHIGPEGTIQITGFRRQQDYDLSPAQRG